MSLSQVWLTTITFVSVSVALYGLLVLYHLAKDDLSGHRPMMKFMSIKFVKLSYSLFGIHLAMVSL